MSRFQMLLPTGNTFAFGFETAPLLYGYFLQVFPKDEPGKPDNDIPKVERDALNRSQFFELFSECLTSEEQSAVRQKFSQQLANIVMDLDSDGQQHGEVQVTTFRLPGQE